jgi:hypothetical protein|tara:strand:- start:3958 stop:4149 length:192 start_codon:yes stop_codon:yes gene_type:complete
VAKALAEGVAVAIDDWWRFFFLFYDKPLTPWITHELILATDEVRSRSSEHFYVDDALAAYACY